MNTKLETTENSSKEDDDFNQMVKDHFKNQNNLDKETNEKFEAKL